MGKNSIPPRQRILEAVIACIEKGGVNELTTRKIAEEAGINLASINYYFRSKDLLIAETLIMTLEHMMGDIRELLSDHQKPFLETLNEVYFYLIDGGLKFPGMIGAHFYEPVMAKNYDGPAVLMMRTLVEELAERAILEYPQKSRRAILLALSNSLSTIMFIELVPDFFKGINPVDYSQPDEIRKMAGYMTRLFESSLDIPYE